MDFFFYGTLRDADVRRRVLGRDLALSAVEDAEIRDFRAVFVTGASYPTLVARRDANAPGVLVRGLNGTDASRLAEFEGTPYQVRRLLVTGERSGGVTARVFVIRGGVRATGRAWTLADWRRRFKRTFLAARPFRPT